MKINKNYYWIFAILCIGTNIHASPVLMDAPSPSFSPPMVCKPATENETEPTMDAGSLGHSISLEETQESPDALNTPGEPFEPTLSVSFLSSDKESEQAPKENSVSLPATSSNASDTNNHLDSFTGIKTWLEGTALPVLQNAKNYTTDNLIPQAQEMTENVAYQAKETGKTIIEYMNSNFVPKLKDLASTIGQTLISWAAKSETKSTAEETEDMTSEPKPSQETPII